MKIQFFTGKFSVFSPKSASMDLACGALRGFCSFPLGPSVSEPVARSSNLCFPTPLLQLARITARKPRFRLKGKVLLLSCGSFPAYFVSFYILFVWQMKQRCLSLFSGLPLSPHGIFRDTNLLLKHCLLLS